jgi:hypothetical protein
MLDEYKLMHHSFLLLINVEKWTIGLALPIDFSTFLDLESDLASFGLSPFGFSPND